ncbi:MAG: gamma-glutamyl-gamma-aminobutyrate hydrolase family protein [Syntrophomonadaceae bacterium]|nr:gamma-glutamyl-gamma-aminobutyrate hydrolase family protein [Syntrophomonadaceae bacterium]
MLPRIGITCAFNFKEDYNYLRQAYIRPVVAAGGLPILIPIVPELVPAADYLNIVDGLIFSGGGDIDPFFLGELPHPALGEVYYERDRLELDLIRLALQQKIPLLGICRGMQMINAAAGGDLYQDLASQRAGVINHRQSAPRNYPFHSVEAVPGSRLAQALDLEANSVSSAPLSFRVNSLHHQAVRQVAPGFIVSAWAPDGVIEAIEAEGEHFIIGVQWHPEDLWQRDARFLGLFRRLIEAAAKARE